MRTIFGAAYARRHGQAAEEYHWRVPVATTDKPSRPAKAHLIPIISSIRRRWMTRCGHSVNPGFTKPVTESTIRCIRCIFANEAALANAEA